MSGFAPSSVDRFRYTSWSWEPATGEIELHYLLTGPDEAVHLPFTERLTIPGLPAAASPERVEAIRKALRLLWLLAGVSYYKAAAPAQAEVAGGLSLLERAFLADYFLHGLGEFAVVNDLDLTDRPQWEASTSLDDPVAVPDLAQRPLVPIGGGKDSTVSVETLRRAGLDPVQFTVNENAVTTAVMAVNGLPAVHAHRRIDPALLDLNAHGALNGHIPITAIVSVIAVASALALGLDTVVMSNERSASEGNLTWHGHEVNHQHSKSIAFERQLATVLRDTVTPSLRWFSLLRPLSELHIGKLMAGLTSYHSTFRSCNRAFHIDPTKRQSKWCGHCPKCHFVSLALAPWLSREEVVAIIGTDVLDDLEQAHGVRELLGIGGDKPFECVGEIAESRAMLLLAAARPEWADAALIQLLEPEVRAAGAPSDEDVRIMLTPASEHSIPAGYPRPETVLG